MTIENRVPLTDNTNTDVTEPTTNNPFKDDKDDNGCCSFFLLPVAIAAVVIANQYPDSSCSSKDGIIDTQLFLYIAGYIQIGWCAFRLFINCCSYGCNDKEKKECKQCIDCPNCLIGIFNLVWAGIGLYIYNNELNEECQNTKIGIMILSWSIIQYAFVLLCICAMFCFCCYHKDTLIKMAKTECEKNKNGKCNSCKCNNNNNDKVGTESLV
mmetsp:Transcript_2282/g.1985  ORF Transcript_2282/g.1985 Transcript_2282/m.1985 type:complete len:212 (-) Transcript_2282:99-734(-)